MRKEALLPTWAPRVKPYLIRRLYESDACGLLDEELLDEVGWALYSRCVSFISATQATLGCVSCPACGGMVRHSCRTKDVLLCNACGWECPWRNYLKTIRDQQLNGGPEVLALFQDYLDRFPRARTYPEKMLLIDALIHGFHHFLGSGRTRRPVGVNLIDGDLQFVMEFLDRLSCSPGSTPGVERNQSEWRGNIHRHFYQNKK